MKVNSVSSSRRNSVRLRYTGVNDPTIKIRIKRPLTVDERLTLMFSSIGCELPKMIRRVAIPPRSIRAEKISSPSLNMNLLLLDHSGPIETIDPTSVDLSLAQFWFSDSFLWYYASKYKEYFGAEPQHLTGITKYKWGNFSSRFAVMSERFGITPVEMKQYIDWVFDSGVLRNEIANCYGKSIVVFIKLFGDDSSDFISSFRSDNAVIEKKRIELPKKKVMIPRTLRRRFGT